jgi:hypothetical protein
LFLAILRETLEPLGFTLTRDPFYGISFVRELTSVRHFLDIDIAKKGSGAEVRNLFAGIRFKDVESLIAKFETYPSFVSERDLERRRTVGLHLGWSPDGFKRRTWGISDSASIQKAAGQVLTLISDAGLPFFDRYSDPDEALKVLCSDDKNTAHLAAAGLIGAKGAIALTMLIRGPAEAELVKENKLKLLKERNNDDYAELLEWAAKLFAQAKETSG